MKNFFATFLAAIIATIVCAQTSNPKTDIPITPKPNIPTSSTKPRTVLFNDIEAYYCDNTITIIFNVDLGIADISIINSITGDMYYASHNGVGCTMVNITDDTGTYQIYIDTDDGAYSGEFTL